MGDIASDLVLFSFCYSAPLHIMRFNCLENVHNHNREYCELLANLTNRLHCDSQRESFMNMVASYSDTFWLKRIYQHFLIFYWDDAGVAEH